jgi:hypothetical protein
MAVDKLKEVAVGGNVVGIYFESGYSCLACNTETTSMESVVTL